jgi:hypothetical protein
MMHRSPSWPAWVLVVREVVCDKDATKILTRVGGGAIFALPSWFRSISTCLNTSTMSCHLSIALLASCTVVWLMRSISGVSLGSSAMGRYRRRLVMVHLVMVQ